MDPNLEKIIYANRFAIRHGSIHKTCTQAEDYLVYVLGYDEPAIKKELDVFVKHVKTLRRRGRAKTQKETHQPNQQRPAPSAPSQA